MEFEKRAMTIREADRRYADLKRQHEAGTIGDEEFAKRLKDLMVQDGEGRWWAKSRTTGEWHYNDGNTWVKGTPPGYEPNDTTTSTPSEEDTTKAGEQARPADRDDAQPPSPVLGKNWWAVASGGLTLAIFGALIALPLDSLIPSDSMLIANGVLAVIASRTADRRLLLLPQGIVGSLAGLAAILAAATERYLTNGYAIVFWAIGLGVIQVIVAYRLRQEIKAIRLMMISGALLVVYGIYVLLVILGAYAIYFQLLEAIWPLAAGVLLAVFAYQVRPRDGSETGG